jgi:ribosomal protection tetracycline resistance protein
LQDPTFSEAATELLATNDDKILRRYLDEAPIAPGPLRQALADQTTQLHVLPVFFGAALTGVGVEDILHAIPQLLPSADGNATGPASGTVFKIERGPSREKVAFVRMFSGTLRMRDHVRLGFDTSEVGTVTAIEVFDRGNTKRTLGDSCGRDRQAPRTLDRAHRRHLRPDRPRRRAARVCAADTGDRDRATSQWREAGCVRRSLRSC